MSNLVLKNCKTIDNKIVNIIIENGIIKDIDNFVRALEKTKKETGKNIIVKVEQEKELH